MCNTSGNTNINTIGHNGHMRRAALEDKGSFGRSSSPTRSLPLGAPGWWHLLLRLRVVHCNIPFNFAHVGVHIRRILLRAAFVLNDDAAGSSILRLLSRTGRGRERRSVQSLQRAQFESSGSIISLEDMFSLDSWLSRRDRRTGLLGVNSCQGLRIHLRNVLCLSTCISPGTSGPLVLQRMRLRRAGVLY